MTDLLDTSDVNLKEQEPGPRSQLKHHYPGICLIILYIPLVIVPWIITVVLSYRPISKSTYYYPEGFEMHEYKRMRSWVNAISVLNSIASLLAVPVVSFVIAQTAVIFSQKRAPARQLSVRDVFALADRAWTDISVLAKLVRAKGHGSRAFNGFIALASGLLLISALQPPLYQILVDWKSINIPSGILERIPISPSVKELRKGKIFIGDDVEPAVMEMIPHATVLQNVQFELPSIKRSVPEMYMWIDYNGTQPPVSKLENRQGDAINSLLNVRIRNSTSRQNILPAFFAALPFNVTTGTKRYHAMRFNSTVECEFLAKDKFPTDCSGSKPYNTSIEVRNSTSSSELRICVPGTWGTSPWTLSRNRQDIKEEVYLQLVGDSEENTLPAIHCSAATTRGYFEIGNYKTKGAYGPLLEHWPAPGVMERDFNDRGSSCTSGNAYSCNSPQTYIPTEWDTKTDRVLGWTPDEPEYMRWNASGPLVTSVMALFGNDSWIRTAVNLTSTQDSSSNGNPSAPIWWKPFCERQPLYHSNITQCDSEKPPGETVAQWFAAYFTRQKDPEEGIEGLLFSGIVLANRAILLTHRDSQAPRLLHVSGGRSIYSSSGFSILKPNMSVASIVGISVLLAVQIAGLIFCGIYIARTPTWTRVFNAMAVARIGAGLEKDKLPVDGQYAEDVDYEKLRVVEVPLRMASADAIRRRPG